MGNAPGIVSVDDHVVEPAAIWSDRLPRKYSDVAPRVVRERGSIVVRDGGSNYDYAPDPDGRECDVWHYEDVVSPLMRLVASAGCDRSDPGMYPITYEEMRPGCYQQQARLSDMDVNGVDASLCFPNFFVRFAGQRFLHAKDKTLAELCVRAYNDWILEEWSAGSRGRLVPVCIIPLWDPELAAKEVRRVAALGNKAVTFSELPTYLELPSLYSGHWEPFLHACAETGTVVYPHIGSGSRMPTTSPDAPPIIPSVLTFMNPAMAVSDWIMSGTLAKFPSLRVAFAECQIGWLPYLLDRMDHVWRDFWAWGWGEDGGRTLVPEPPSYYFRRQVLCAFFDDPHGVNSLDVIGERNVAFEVDYPHTDGTWPDSQAVATKLFGHLDPDIVHRLTRQNAIDFFNLDLH